MKARNSVTAKLRYYWRTLFPRTIREFEQAYCTICDGRIWFWQNSTRLYELGATRAHIDCANKFLASELAHKCRHGSNTNA